MSQDYTILSLDLGINLGWCLVKNGVIVQGGVFPIKTKSEKPGAKFDKFESEFLAKFVGVNEICYEEVQFVSYEYQHRMWSVLWGILNKFTYRHNIRLFGINTASVKKEFTGDGKADKAMICATAHTMGWKQGEPGTDLDHDAADAIACAVVTLGRRGVPVTFK